MSSMLQGQGEYKILVGIVVKPAERLSLRQVLISQDSDMCSEDNEKK